MAQSFAKIVDYKSSFTSRHSIGVAEKASMLAKYMGYDSVTVQKMYLAGALHDIGKMAVGNEILEKPDAIYENRGCFRQIVFSVIYWYDMDFQSRIRMKEG